MNNGATEYQPVPDVVADDEPLNRRLHAMYVKEDGSASSAAFTDDELSVDRGLYRTHEQSLADYPQMGLAQLLAIVARGMGQNVVACKELLNPAHAEVRGKKTRAVAKKLARASKVVVRPATAAQPVQDRPDDTGAVESAQNE